MTIFLPIGMNQLIQLTKLPINARYFITTIFLPAVRGLKLESKTFPKSQDLKTNGLAFMGLIIPL